MWDWTTDHGLPRIVIDCDSKAAADGIRRQWPDALADSDDARRCRVTLSGDIREPWLREIQQLAAEETPETYGQRSLTAAERERIDFSETSVPHARSCKAIGKGMGVDDWLAWYDPTLSVAEHREIYHRPSGSAPTLREMPTPREFQRRQEVSVR
jgi:hypothetical protein